VLLNVNAELVRKVAALEHQNKCLASNAACNSASRVLLEIQDLKLKVFASDSGNKTLQRDNSALQMENERLKNLQTVEAGSRASQESSTEEAGNVSVFLSCNIESTCANNLAFCSTYFRETVNKCCASTLRQSGGSNSLGPVPKIAQSEQAFAPTGSAVVYEPSPIFLEVMRSSF
jgi:hypothetical protein